MESRFGNTASKLRKSGKARSGAGLPADFLAMVVEVFTTNFDGPLNKLAKIKAGPAFKAAGEVFPNEILLSLTLAYPEQLAATTVHASVEFDPKASSPTAEDLLTACVDALGEVFGGILVDDQEKLENLADEALSALQDVPFEWTPVEIDKHRVFVKIDKSNPELDQLADEWLSKHDPSALDEDKGEQKRTEKLFVAGPKRPEELDLDEEESDDESEEEHDSDYSDEDDDGETVH